MLRTLVALILFALLPTCFGCAMCCGTDDYNYATYGGRWQRHDRSRGRVGSVFAPAGADTLAEAEPTVEREEARPGDDEITDEAETGHTTLASFIE